MEKTVRLKDIAKKLGVSITTVSKALNDHPDISEDRKEQILELVSEMKYIPNTIAQNLRKRSTKFIGLIITDNTNPYFARLIKGAEEEIAKHNYHTIIFNTNENPDRELEIIKDLLSINVAGVIITPVQGSSSNIKILRDFKIPFVLANRYIKKDEDNYVIADDAKAGYIATDYLIKKGNNKIIFINGYEDLTSAVERKAGYMKALEDNELDYLESQVYSNIIDNTSGYEIVKKKVLAEHKPPYAVLCYSDYIASGVIKCLFENNLEIPNDISVMGIDNIKLLSFSYPSLSTVSIPKFQIGTESARMLFNLINNTDSKDNQLVLNSKLIVRDTA